MPHGCWLRSGHDGEGGSGFSDVPSEFLATSDVQQPI